MYSNHLPQHDHNYVQYISVTVQGLGMRLISDIFNFNTKMRAKSYICVKYLLLTIRISTLGHHPIKPHIQLYG